MGSTILNVDDHEINRYIRTQVLQQAGYRVVEAATGGDAISKCASEKPSLVLLDVNLPDMHGTDVCRRIKADSSMRTFVVHVSATNVETSHQAYGLKGGADGYLCEPVDPELLIATVGSFLRLREAEIKLQDSQERLAQAQTIAGLTFWEWDIARDRVLQSGEDHGNPQEVSFDEWLTSMHEEDRGPLAQALQEACRGEKSFSYEFRQPAHEGAWRWLATKGRVFYDAHGKAVRAIGTDMEITERKRIELALKRSNEDLSQFAFMISHDLQEPLRTITTFTELLSLKYSRALDDEATSYLSYVAEGSSRMNAMITELLAFCHIQNSDMTSLQPVPLEDVLRGVLANVSTALEESGGTITHDPLPVVLGDPAQLAEVFQNVIANALKYRKTGEAPRIHVSIRRGKKESIISITDNGVGFDQKHAEEIFGMFKRLHGREIQGSGIGLAVVKKIVARHGGRIWAKSQQGQGACFSFTLPDHL
jgi:signal transduction histidine kinase